MKKIIFLLLLVDIAQSVFAQTKLQVPDKRKSVKTLGLSKEAVKKIANSIEMVTVVVGAFSMGGNYQECEWPIHSVSLSSFKIGKYEITQLQWRAVMGNNPSKHMGCDSLPVEQVSWDDVQIFLNKLNLMTGKKYRLPTEAEWEYTAKGGNQTHNYSFSGSNNIDDVAWYESNSDGITHPVGQKQANELGIFDMSGNVWEWCSDWFGADYYAKSASNDPKGPTGGNFLVYRGGSYFSNSNDCRSVFRSYNNAGFKNSSVGLRVVLSLF